MVLVLLFLLQWEIFLHRHAPSRGEGRETMKEVKTFLCFWWLAFCHLHVSSLAYVGLSLLGKRGGGISALILRSHDGTLTSEEYRVVVAVVGTPGYQLPAGYIHTSNSHSVSLSLFIWKLGTTAPTPQGSVTIDTHMLSTGPVQQC